MQEKEQTYDPNTFKTPRVDFVAERVNSLLGLDKKEQPIPMAFPAQGEVVRAIMTRELHKFSPFILENIHQSEMLHMLEFLRLRVKQMIKKIGYVGLNVEIIEKGLDQIMKAEDLVRLSLYLHSLGWLYNDGTLIQERVRRSIKIPETKPGKATSEELELATTPFKAAEAEFRRKVRKVTQEHGHVTTRFIRKVNEDGTTSCIHKPFESSSRKKTVENQKEQVWMDGLERKK